jgi:hypothetical protein
VLAAELGDVLDFGINITLGFDSSAL